MITKSKAIRDINKKYFNKGINPNSLKNLKTDTKWQNLPTTAIRIPSILKDEILDYAHQLDKENSNTEKLLLQDIITELEIILATPVRKSQGVEVLKSKIQALKNQLSEKAD